MIDLLYHFDAVTMAILVSTLCLSLSVVLLYMYLFRRTYPGFGSMTLAHFLLFGGTSLSHFRPIDLSLSIFLGSLFMLLYGAFLFRGLLLYGDISPKYRMLPNYAVIAAIAAVLAYFMFIDFNICARMTTFSVGMAFIFFRLALEPYVSKTWKRHATQSVLSLFFLMFAALFVVRAYQALQSVQCLASGLDDMAKILFFIAIVIIPILTFCIIAMTFARMETELKYANEELQVISETDALTGLSNRRKFDAVYENEWKRAVSMQLDLAVVILDVDDFKHYNDQYGHQEGDECLRKLAQVLQTHALPAACLAARYGGEEFALILPGMDAKKAVTLVEDVRQTFAQIAIEHTTGRHGNIATISAGVAVLEPVGQKNMFDLLRAADSALYAAKAKGKNTVVLSA